MVINVLDRVPHCYTSGDGETIASLVRQGFARGDRVTVSMAGVPDVPSAFVNAAFVSLLDDYDFDFIRHNLSITDSTPQINHLIRRRFQFVSGRSVAG
jgi:hypothetical protein